MPNFERKKYTHIDEYGIDPLKDPSFDAIASIEDWSIYTITDADVGNTPLIAFNHYNDTALWWVIQHFNAITDPHTELTAGTQIRIPSYATVISELSKLGPQRQATFRI